MLNKMKIFMFPAVAAVLLMTAAGTAAEKGMPADKAATVNGVVITRQAFELEVNQIRAQFARQGRPINDAQMAEIAKGILENLISRELLYQESTKQGVSADDAAVAEQIRLIKERFPDENQYRSALEGMGFTEAALTSKIKYDLTVKTFIDKRLGAKTEVADQEIRAYYDQHPDYFKQSEKVKASHILIKVEAGAGEAEKKEARSRIEAVRAKIAQGEDFGAMARQYSQGPSNTREGDLGYFGRNQMVKPFEEAAFALKAGEVSGIVETPFGYHLIKVFDKKPAGVEAYDDVRERIAQYLKKNKVQKEVTALVENLKGKAMIERF